MRTLMVAALVWAAAGCGPPGGALAADELRTKMLRYQQNHLHQRKFYVGVAQGADLQAATGLAYDAITRQLTWLPSSSSRDVLRGLYRVDRSATDSSGEVHVLAVLEREAAASHLRRLRDEQRATLRLSLISCREKVNTADREGARRCVRDLSALVVQARDLHVAARAALGDEVRATPLPEEGQVKALTLRFGSAETMGKSMLVRVVKVTGGRRLGDLTPTFQTVVSEAGRKLASGSINTRQVIQALAGNTRGVAAAGKRAGAGYVLVGRVRATFSGSEMGQYFAHAGARLKVIETVSGRTVKELSSDNVKGGHISRRQALDKAVSNAVKELTPKLRQWLNRR